ncbi:beta-propeller domain-containing protein [Stratiformator vulcanicus]|uniref:Arylsulfotransferase (ASST) n=1 Tax=Stratiformator vulcanicus TaxID=2527980 RepID=A0A517R322_9PLAN|nr:PQQ-binding-like beta-propeller repeat protein [Stratiformator vulcanicus]QDT38290.1 hypothetical protein Pan189_26810 [Stratiformator vulcanicus]
MKTLIATFLCLLAANSPCAAEDRLVIGAESGKGLTIVDPTDGNRVLWHWDRKGPVHDLQLLKNRRLLTHAGSWHRLVEIDIPTQEVVWEYDAAKQNRDGDYRGKVEVHAFERLADGNTMIAESGPGRIIEVDRAGDLVKVVSLDVLKSSVHSDTRLVRKLDNGHYLVAHERDGRVKEYDAEGAVVWDYEVPLFGRRPSGGHGPESWGGKCFSATKNEAGNYLIATGNGHSVLEVTPAKEIVWHLAQHDLPGITLAWTTNVHQLPNGNLIIGNCHAGPENPQLVEVTRDKEVVWQFKDFKNFGNGLANTLVLDGEDANALRRLID